MKRLLTFVALLFSVALFASPAALANRDVTSVSVVGAQSPNPVIAGGSTTYGTTGNSVNVVFGSGGGTCTSTMSVSAGLPTGATATFNPSSVVGTGSGTVSTVLSIATTGATAAGTYTITVRATDTTANGCNSNSSQSTTTSFVVAAVTPNTITAVGVGTQSPSPVTAGSSATYAITTAWAGNAATCTSNALAVVFPGGTPTGVTTGFSPTTVTNAATTSTLTISTTGSTPAATSAFSVTGSTTAAGGCGTSSITNTTGSLAVAVNTTTSVVSNGTPSTYGNAVIFSATVSPVPNTGDTVTFKNGAATIGTGTTNGSGQAQLTISTLPAATNSITAVFAGDASHNTSTSTAFSQVVNKLSISANVTANSKIYDGTTTATIATCTLTGVLAGDSGNVTCSAAGPNTFSSASVANGVTVTATGIALAGSASGNYVLSSTSATTTANITQKALTGAGTLAAVSKPYDKTNVATFTGTAALLTAEAPGSGTTADNKPYTGDTVSVTGTPAGTFASVNVANGIVVSVTGLSLTGSSAGNYTLTQPSFTANITKRLITVTAATNSKTYDGGTTAAAIPTITVGSLAVGDTSNFTEAYSSKNVGTGLTLTPTGTVNDGNGGANYTVSFATNTTGVIIADPITVTAATNTKVYNGTTSSTGVPTITSGSLQGTDTANFTEAFASKNVGTGLTIIPAGTVTDGNAGNNYSYTFVNNTTGVITARPLTITGAANSKPYDGTTTAATVPTVTSGTIQTGDTAGFIEAYTVSTVGTGLTLVPSGIVNDGNSGNNYSYTFVNSANGVITNRTTTTGVALSPTSVSVGGSSTVTVTVTDTTGNGFNPAGTIALTSSDTGAKGDTFTICTLAPSGANAATCTSTVTVNEQGTSPHTITATYTANDSIHASGSGNAPLTVTSETITATTVGTQTPTPAIVGSSSTYLISTTWTGSGTCTSAPLSINWTPAAGETAAFSPTTVSNGTTTTTLTISSTTATPAGSTNFTVTAATTGGTGACGTSTSTSSTHTFVVTIETITNATVGTQTPNPVVAGSQATYAITTTWAGSTTCTSAPLVINWTAPTDAVATFSPTTVSNSSTGSTLTITTDGTTPAGTTNFTVTAATTGGTGNCGTSTFTTTNHTFVVVTPAVISSVTVGTQTPNPVAASLSATYTVTTTWTGTATCTPIVQINWNPSAPTGVTTSITPAITSVAPSSTLTVVTTGSTPAGTTPFTVTVTSTGGTGGAACGTGSITSSGSNLVVQATSAGNYTEPFNTSHGWSYQLGTGGCSGGTCSNNAAVTVGADCQNAPCVSASITNTGFFSTAKTETGYFHNPAGYTWQTVGVPANATVVSVKGAWWDLVTGGGCDTTTDTTAGIHIFNSGNTTEITTPAVFADTSVLTDTGTAGVTHGPGTAATVNSGSTASSTLITLRFDINPSTATTGFNTTNTCNIFGDNFNLIITYTTPGSGRRGQVIIGFTRTPDGGFQLSKPTYIASPLVDADQRTDSNPSAIVSKRDD